MTFDRTAYLKTFYSTADLNESMLQVLILLGTHCNDDCRLRVRSFTRQVIAHRLHWGAERTRNAIRRLQEARLLSIVRVDRHQWWQLPTEDQLALYTA